MANAPTEGGTNTGNAAGFAGNGGGGAGGNGGGGDGGAGAGDSGFFPSKEGLRAGMLLPASSSPSRLRQSTATGMTTGTLSVSSGSGRFESGSDVGTNNGRLGCLLLLPVFNDRDNLFLVNTVIFSS